MLTFGDGDGRRPYIVAALTELLEFLITSRLRAGRRPAAPLGLTEHIK